MSQFSTGLLPSHDVDGDSGYFPVMADNDVMSVDELKEVLSQRRRARDVFPFSKFGTNQNPYNSCNAHGLRNALVRSIFARTGDFVDLAPHSSYAWMNGGQDRGSALVDAMKVVEVRGMLTTADCKPNQIYLRQYSDSAWEKAKRWRAKAIECRSEMKLLTAIARGMFGAIATQVNDAYANWNGGGLTPVGKGIGNHAVCVHDAWWDESIGMFVFEGPGSWGNWGDGGHWRHTWTQVATPNTKHCFYAVEASFDDPEDPTQPPVVQ